MDIEGGEMIVLQDMKEYLVKYLPTLYLSLHPYFVENRETYSDMIVGTLKIYPHVYLSNGVEFRPDDLIPILKSLPRGNLSVIGSVLK
jgi:ABC-type transport system substrate-binding protein